MMWKLLRHVVWEVFGNIFWISDGKFSMKYCGEVRGDGKPIEYMTFRYDVR
jgi:hypothetical protein